MQLKYLIITIIVLVQSAFAYECKMDALSFKAKSKKEAFLFLNKQNRDIVFSGMLFDVTHFDGNKKNEITKLDWMLDYLENTELNSDYQAFVKLLKISSDLDTKKPHHLESNEVCDILTKVNDLVKKKSESTN